MPYGYDNSEVKNMPGLSTHYLFGVGTLKYIKRLKIHGLICSYPCVYALGQQGPDVLFYYPQILKRHNIGLMMHNEHTAEFFNSMLHYIESYAKTRRDRELLTVYMAGFLGHYVLDRTVHPYVYAYSMKGGRLRQHGRHFRLETEIDAYLLKNTKKIQPGFFKGGKTLALSPQEEKAVIDLLQYAVFATYRIRLSKSRLKATLRIMRFVHAVLRDKRGIKKRMLCSLEETVLGFPFLSCLIADRDEPADRHALLNLKHRKWHNPWKNGHSSRASVPDMLKRARKEYITVLKEYDGLFEAVSGSRESFLNYIGNCSYHTGMNL